MSETKVERGAKFIASLVTIIAFILTWVISKQCHCKSNISNIGMNDTTIIKTPEKKSAKTDTTNRTNIKLEKEFSGYSRYITKNSPLSSHNGKNMIISITKEYSFFDEISTVKIFEIASKKGYTSKLSIFSDTYYQEKLGKKLILGDAQLIIKLNLNIYADYLLIGNYSIDTNPSEMDSRRTTARVVSILNMIDLKDGSIKNIASETFTANGSKEIYAKEHALDVFYDFVEQTNF